MSDLNGQGSSSKAQAPALGQDYDSTTAFGGGFQPQTKMTVQPPKKEDLQRSYGTLVGDDANPKGWYGSMSASRPPSTRVPRC